MEKLTQDELLRKWQLVKALYDRPGTEGEKQAAATVLKRLQERMEQLRKYRVVAAPIRKYEFIVFTDA